MIYKIILFFVLIAQASSQTILHNELLGRPTDNGVTVQIIFSDSVEARAEYGLATGVYTNQTDWQSFGKNKTGEIIISGLLPNKKYFYRLNYRNPGAADFNNRPEYSFHTQRSKTDSFVFVIQADPHLDESSDTALYRVCLMNQLKDKPDFMIDLGDFIMTDKLTNSKKEVTLDTIIYRCKLLRSKYEIICHSLPLFNVLGNHEGEAGWQNNGTANNMAVRNAVERKKYFVNPYPNSFYTGDTANTPFIGQRQSYYAWEWGNALFIVLDPYWFTSPKPDSLTGWRWTLGKVQYDWLRATLEKSKAKFKFVFCHQLVGGNREGRGGTEYADKYEWGGGNIDGTAGFSTNRAGWYKPIKDLLTENKVNIFFHGHDHFFGRQEKNCLIYQETPQPSLPNFNYPNSAAPYGYKEGIIMGNSGHLRVTVTPAGTKVEYVKAYTSAQETGTRHNGDVVATYFIGEVNCYDSLIKDVPMIWNSNYADEIIYPNPFSKETKIEFSVKKSCDILLTIYDAKGGLVRTLLKGIEVSSGKFQVVWDGKSSNGEDLPNGVYYYSINGTKAGKIILLR